MKNKWREAVKGNACSHDNDPFICILSTDSLVADYMYVLCEGFHHSGKGTLFSARLHD